MSEPTINLTLVSPHGSYGDRESQNGIRAFNSAVSQAGAKHSIGVFTVDSADQVQDLLLTGTFGVYLAKHTFPSIVKAIGDWLVAREGRTVKIKVDGVEIEAKSADEAERLMKLALDSLPPKGPGE